MINMSLVRMNHIMIKQTLTEFYSELFVLYFKVLWVLSEFGVDFAATAVLLYDQMYKSL
jgi:hypothetical protein